MQGSTWLLSCSLLEQAGQLVISTILARLLGPEDFGLVAVVMIILMFGDILSEGGFGQSLIQSKDTTNDDEASVFQYNIVVSSLLLLVVCCSAPMLARFLQYERLTQILPFLALGLPLGALANVPQRLLCKRLKFRKIALVSLLSTLFAGVIGVVCAVRGWGVWSLVTQYLILKLGTVCLIWGTNTWWPRGNFRWSSLRKLRQFGGNLFAAALLNAVVDNLAGILIAKYYDPTQLAFYTRANRYQALPAQNLSKAANSVLFPVFSGFQDNPSRLRNATKRATRMLCFVCFPIMGMLIATSENLIRWVLTEKWLPMHPYFQLLCIAGALYPLHAVNLSVLKAQGRSDLFLKLELLKKGLVVTVILCAFPFGVFAMVVGHVVISVVAFGMNTHYTGRTLGYGAARQFVDAAPYLLWSAVMAISIAVFQWSIGWRLPLELGSAFLLGVTVYLSGCAISGCSALRELVELLRKERDIPLLADSSGAQPVA
jgi:O-antigen/teichoic acid export membrane protein